MAPLSARAAAAALGIAGGVALLAAFVPGMPWTAEAFQLRLVLYNAGGIALVAAVSGARASAGSLPRAMAVAAILANAWYLVMTVLSIGRPQLPDPDPDFRFMGFLAGAAMWLADAAFGAVAVGARTVARPAAVAPAMGSLLAFTGMGQLELVSGELGWLFTPVALAGVALNGAAWILIGLELLRREPHAMGVAA